MKRAAIAVFLLAAGMWTAIGFDSANDALFEHEVVTGQPVAAPELPCDWFEEFSTTLSGLGENPASWTIQEGEWMGAAFSVIDLAAINPDVACEDVAWTLTHEYIHLLQYRALGPASGEYYEGRVERIADCGARLLGEEPQDPDHPVMNGVCSVADLWEAHALINFSREGTRV